MNFKVGQKVVCIYDDWERKYPEVKYPARNEIYTISAIIPQGQDTGLRFCEIASNFPFSAFNFRPLDEVAKGVTMTFEKLQTVQPIYQS